MYTKRQILLTALLLLTAAATQAQFTGTGTGINTDPYIITTAAQLDEVRNHLDKHFRLGNDIDLTDYLASGGDGFAKWGAAGWIPIGNYSPNGPFTGTLNGGGHKITGLWIDRSSTDEVGLFGYTLVGSKIDSLGVEIAAKGIKGNEYVGGLVGDSRGTISNCYATGKVSGTDYVGGLVGLNNSGIFNCYATGNVTGTGNAVGGLVGVNNGYISNCYATGNVT